MAETEKTLLDLAKGQGSNAPEGAKPVRETRPSDIRAQQTAGGNPIQDALNELLANTKGKGDWVSVDLPSRGVFNKGLSSVKVRPFNFEDEKLLRSIKKASDASRVLDTLMERCIQGVDVPSLVMQDKNFLLFKLRELSYGEDYPIESLCTGCGEKNELVVNLPSLGVNYYPEDKGDVITVDLPDTGVVAHIRPPRASEESLLETGDLLMTNMYRFVKKLNDYTDPSVIREFIPRITIKDLDCLRTAIFDTSYGLNTKVRYLCSNCGADEILDLPLNANFFSAS